VLSKLAQGSTQLHVQRFQLQYKTGSNSSSKVRDR
jgi:hypothetical protein